MKLSLINSFKLHHPGALNNFLNYASVFGRNILDALRTKICWVPISISITYIWMVYVSVSTNNTLESWGMKILRKVVQTVQLIQW
jgi:hypothetical protein